MTSRLPLVLAVGLVAVVAGCSGDEKSATTSTTAASLFSGGPRTVTFAETRTAIGRLYTHHPEIRSFVSRDVYYTPETRDKVLAVCRQGGPSVNARERETSRVFGCAPLIFFFYSFGARKKVMESIRVARDLYRYAAGIKGPYDPQAPLADLLRRWGIH